VTTFSSLLYSLHLQMLTAENTNGLKMSPKSTS